MTKARNLSLLSAVEAGATTDQTKADLNDIGVSGGRKNLIINGGMDVWQRGTTTTTVASGSTYRTLDRFWTLNAGAAAGTHARSTDVPVGEGFNYSLSMTNVSGGYIGASVELNATGKAGPFKPNTDYTLSFWLKGTGGTLEAHYRNAVANGTNSTEVQSAVTIPSNAGWVKHSTTINTGSVTPHANNTHMGFDLAGFASGGLTTGWQLEEGSVATDFEHATSYGETLALCQRYYHRSTFALGRPCSSGGSVNSSTIAVIAGMPHPVIMRASPTGTLSGSTHFAIRHRSVATTCTGVQISADERSTYFQGNVASGLTIGDGCYARSANNGAWLAFDAEL